MKTSTLLKQVIETLPGDQFVRTWACIEEIGAALDKAGDAAALSLLYTEARYKEYLAKVKKIRAHSKAKAKSKK